MRIPTFVLVALVLASPVSGWSSEADMNALLARVQALENKNKELETRLKVAEVQQQGPQITTAAIEHATAKAQEQMNKVLTVADPHCRPLVIGGYLDLSYEYNFNRPDNVNNNQRIFDKDSNGFDAHLAELCFSRLPSDCGQAGFRIDVAAGTDARVFAAQDNTALPASRGQDFEIFDLKQAYVSYIAPVGSGITLDAGKFVTWAGAEVIEAADDMNSSRSFLFGDAVPFTHTGVRATYTPFKDKWTVGLGLVNGWDNVQDQNNAKTVMAESNWTPTKWFNWVVVGIVGDEQTVDERARFANAVAAGADPNDPATPGFGALAEGKNWDSSDQSQPRGLIDTTLTFTPWEKWTFQLNADWATEGDVPRANGPRNRQWWGAAGYVKWQFHKNWYLANRTEYFNDEEGARTGRRQALWETTLTADWALSEPMHLRLEYRHDHSNVEAFGDERGVGDNFVPGSNPFHSHDQDTIMMQWLYKF